MPVTGMVIFIIDADPDIYYILLYPLRPPLQRHFYGYYGAVSGPLFYIHRTARQPGALPHPCRPRLARPGEFDDIFSGLLQAGGAVLDGSLPQDGAGGGFGGTGCCPPDNLAGCRKRRRYGYQYGRKDTRHGRARRGKRAELRIFAGVFEMTQSSGYDIIFPYILLIRQERIH